MSAMRGGWAGTCSRRWRAWRTIRFVGDVRGVGFVGDVRGVGFVGGLDIVADKRTHAMFDPALDVSALIERNLKKHALILRVIGNRIALSPPVIITEGEVDEMVARLERALDNTAAELRGLSARLRKS